MKYFATKISENIHETPEGFLLCTGVSIARTGEMEYAEGETPLKAKNGKVIIFRSEAEVFDPKTIASFEGKPFTINHPDDFVDTNNWRELANGHIQNVRRGEGDQKDDLVADVLITSADAILLVKQGIRGLSCGYEAEFIETEEGRGEQKAIVGNHLALVSEGRAGPTYSINDHKGDGFMSKFSKTMAEKLKGVFSKAVDEAMTEDAEKTEKAAEEKTKDASAMDALLEKMNDMMEMVKGMSGAKKTDDKEETAPAPEEKPAKDADPLEERLAKLEAMVAKIIGAEKAESEAMGDEEKEESEDSESPEVVGDSAEDVSSRAEILCPGIEITKDVKTSALQAAYKTADGKKVIDSLSAGKPKFDDENQVNLLFLAASELLKATRSSELATAKIRAKSNDFQSAIFTGKDEMTAEKMNEINAKRYAQK